MAVSPHISDHLSLAHMFQVLSESNFHWWSNKSTEINISQQKSTNIKPAPGTGPKPEKFLSSESGRCPKGLQCLRTLMWNRGPPWASRWNGKHQQLMVRHIWVGSGRDIHILLDISWYECPYSDCFYISFLWFVFVIFHLSESPPQWVAPNPGGCPVTAYAITQATSATSANMQVLHKNLKVLYWKPAFFCWSKGNNFISSNRLWMDINGSGMAILLF